MTIINHLFRAHAPEYLKKFGDKMPSNHKKAIGAILNCKTPEYGATVYRCCDCNKTHYIYRSCGDRHCPGCQTQKTQEWLLKQSQRQLPGPHFLVTFTVPEKLREYFRRYQRKLYSALFAASSEALKALLTKGKNASGGAIPGFFGVLHTWGRQLQYHPHIHYVVTGGTLSLDRQQWYPTAPSFLLPVRALSTVFKAKFKDLLCKEGLFNEIDQSAWKQDWVVNCQPVGDGAATLKYLAPYVFKVAISNSRILKVDGNQVHIRYKKVGSNRPRTLVLSVMEFMRRFLTHVLPKGFMKIRYFGFMHPNFSVSGESLPSMIAKTIGARVSVAPPKSAETEEPAPLLCEECGGILRLECIILPYFGRSSG